MRGFLTFVLVVSPLLALYFRVDAVYFTFAAMTVGMFVQVSWFARRMKRVGYDERSAAAWRSTADLAIGLAVLLVAFLIQSYFQLWFAQHRFCRYC